MSLKILRCNDIIFIGAVNRLKRDEIKNLPSEELGINTPEGRPYLMITLMSKVRKVYEEYKKSTTPEEIARFNKFLKSKGCKIPEEGIKVLSWKLTEAEENVRYEVCASEIPLTLDELVEKTHLTKKNCYKSAEALIKLKEIYLWDGLKYKDAQPRYGASDPYAVIDENVTDEAAEERLKKWQIANPSVSQQLGAFSGGRIQI